MMNQIIRYNPVISFIRKNKLKNILEVWSWSKWIGKFMPFLKYTWLDKTTSDYWNKELKTSKNMFFIDWDVLNMPFDDNKFDLVFSLDMIEHIKESDRLKAIDEIIRVSNKFVIIAFPFWNLATATTKLYYEYYLQKDGKVDWWLREHYENWLPNIDFIKKIKNKYNKFEIKEFENSNIFFSIFILYLESKFPFNIILKIISYFIAYIPISFTSKVWVRKFLIIYKK